MYLKELVSAIDRMVIEGFESFGISEYDLTYMKNKIRVDIIGEGLRRYYIDDCYLFSIITECEVDYEKCQLKFQTKMVVNESTKEMGNDYG